MITCAPLCFYFTESQYSGSSTAAAAGYQQPPAAHQPQPAHQGQSTYERQAAAYQQYAQQYAQQQSPPTGGGGYQAQPSPQSSHTAPPAHTSGHTGTTTAHGSLARLDSSFGESFTQLYIRLCAFMYIQVMLLTCGHFALISLFLKSLVIPTFRGTSIICLIRSIYWIYVITKMS